MNMDKDKTRLVEDNIHVVKAVIKKEIKMNDSDVDLEFNELYQIGCLALCKASITFDVTKNTDFFTYAYKLVKNSLLDHCRRVQRKQKYIVDGGDDMPEGVSIGVHTHTGNEEIYYLHSGKGVLTYDGKEFEMKAGDVSLCKIGHSHGFAAVDHCVLIVVASC